MGVGGARFGTADFIGIYPVSAAFQPTCKFDFVASNMLIDPPGVREGASRGGEAGRGGAGPHPDWPRLPRGGPSME